MCACGVVGWHLGHVCGGWVCIFPSVSDCALVRMSFWIAIVDLRKCDRVVAGVWSVTGVGFIVQLRKTAVAVFRLLKGWWDFPD